MDKEQIIQIIENFAPLNLAEEWDASGRIVDAENITQVEKVMLCLTVTEDVVRQAKLNNCDMIISHHPLFFVPFEYKNINIYCAHTNLDRANGGTTDTLMKVLEMSVDGFIGDFVRFSDTEIKTDDFLKKLSRISKNIRVVNKKKVSEMKKIAFCAGSGSEFIQEAFENGADAFVTGDIKFHTALESPIVLFDIGHFESEIHVLKVFESLLKNSVGIVYAKEESPILTMKF